MGGHVGCLCNNVDLEIAVQSSEWLVMSWLGMRVDGLSAPYLSQCAVVTDFAMKMTVEGGASIFLVLISNGTCKDSGSGTA